MRVLLADDNRDVLAVTQAMLAVEGHEVCVAVNGAEAVRLFQEQAFDVVVLDIEMPVMNGWSALAAIRLLPAGRQVPVILFTAYYNSQYEARAANAGADLLVHKPMTSNDFVLLLEGIDEWRKSR